MSPIETRLGHLCGPDVGVNGLETNLACQLDEYLSVQGFRLLLRAEVEKQKEGMCLVVDIYLSGLAQKIVKVIQKWTRDQVNISVAAI